MARAKKLTTEQVALMAADMLRQMPEFTEAQHARHALLALGRRIDSIAQDVEETRKRLNTLWHAVGVTCGVLSVSDEEEGDPEQRLARFEKAVAPIAETAGNLKDRLDAMDRTVSQFDPRGRFAEALRLLANELDGGQ